ncbi:hypothetical protein NECAME_02311 [Necator americanus]|uniref:Uncharacterized protein n=1 Tax=Necator americanus TaxID=51031 RepID=W2THA2_NECAM|nr:hypothetical protein NECAME_02311 [Necator americanus]ETN80566.1 hypothetical protein NECAME_02311 [Necator americanus]
MCHRDSAFAVDNIATHSILLHMRVIVDYWARRFDDYRSPSTEHDPERFGTVSGMIYPPG